MIRVFDVTYKRDTYINKEYITKIDDEDNTILIYLKDGNWVRTYKQYLKNFI